MHPTIAEICRTRDSNVRPDVFRRWQKELRDVVQPLLNRLEELERSQADSTPVVRPKAKEKSA